MKCPTCKGTGKQVIKVHKTCESWGVTQCRRDIFTRKPPKTTTRWRDVTCKECVKRRGER